MDLRLQETTVVGLDESNHVGSCGVVDNKVHPLAKAATGAWESHVRVRRPTQEVFDQQIIATTYARVCIALNNPQ